MVLAKLGNLAAAKQKDTSSMVWGFSRQSVMPKSFSDLFYFYKDDLATGSVYSMAHMPNNMCKAFHVKLSFFFSICEFNISKCNRKFYTILGKGETSILMLFNRIYAIRSMVFPVWTKNISNIDF